MILANDIRKGDFLKINGKFYKVTETNKNKPGKGPAYMLVEMFCVQTLRNNPHRFGVDEKVEKVFTEEKKVNYSYEEKDEWIFHSPEGEELILPKNSKDRNQLFFPYCETINLVFDQKDGELIYYDPPFHCIITIKETAEAGNVSPNSGRSSKQAILENGVIVHVPNYISSGQKIKIDLRDLSYIEKVK
jgi:elongation factor P